MSTVRKQKADFPAEPIVSEAELDHRDALTPITGSRNGDWNRHLLDRTRDVVKHKHPKQDEDLVGDGTTCHGGDRPPI